MSGLNRREFSKLAAKGIAVVPVAVLTASLSVRAADDAAMVDPESAQAKGLQYTEASDKEAACAGCALYAAVDGKDHGKCIIFSGQLVPAGGWCSAFQAKPA